MMHPGRMILLVEDDDLDADLASRAFQRAKVTNALVRVRDGVEALDYLFGRGKYAARDAHDLPVFVLLDLNIPKIGGLDVLKAFARMNASGICLSLFLPPPARRRID